MKNIVNNSSKASFWKQARILYKPFLFFFLVSFVIWNWNDIFWIFNYRVVLEKFISSSVEAKKAESQKVTVQEESNYFEQENSIEIPAINITAPLLFTSQDETEYFKEYLKDGVLHYPNSALPGTQGAVIILGHSAPPGWPQINYDWVFNDINTLEPGDEIYVYFNNQRYVYKVTHKFFLEKGEEISSPPLTNSKPILLLISCWPPGKDRERIAVEAVLSN